MKKILEPISKMALKAKTSGFRRKTAAAGAIRMVHTMSPEKAVEQKSAVCSPNVFLRWVLITFALVSFLGGCGIALAHDADTPLYERLGVTEPTTLPDSPFYFLKEWGRGIKMLFTFGAVNKAELSLRFTDEKISELDKLLEEKPDEKDTLDRALQNYLDAQARLHERLDSLKGKNKNVNTLLEKLANRVTEHQELFNELKDKADEKKIKQATQSLADDIKKGAELDEEKTKKNLKEKLAGEEDRELFKEIEEVDEELKKLGKEVEKDLDEISEEAGEKTDNGKEDSREDEKLEKEKGVGNSACTKIYAPVCGKDGKTYSNSCVAKAAGIEIVRQGACTLLQKPHTLKITSPNGKEVWKTGTTHDIRWEGGNQNDDISILLFNAEGKQIASLIGDTMTNSGIFKWDLKVECGCPEQTRSLVTPGAYKIKIRAPFASYEDESDNFFTIAVPETANQKYQEFKIEADDLGFYPSGAIAVEKGAKVKIIFTVRTANVYYGGLDFRSNKFATASEKPGGTVTAEFTADESFAISSYWPSSNAYKASLKIEVK